MHSIAAFEEKRHTLRHDCLAAVKWSFVNQSAAYRAHILNFSGSGFYLVTDLAIKPGTIVWIRVHRRLYGGTAEDCSECLPTTAVVEAMWCRELPESAQSRYGIGLRFQVPMI